MSYIDLSELPRALRGPEKLARATAHPHQPLTKCLHPDPDQLTSDQNGGSVEYMHLTRCGAAEETMGFCAGPAHTWEQSRVYSSAEGCYVEQGAYHCVAPWLELEARGATGLDGDDAEAFRRWLADGAPGAVERVWDEEKGEYVVPSVGA